MKALQTLILVWCVYDSAGLIYACFGDHREACEKHAECANPGMLTCGQIEE